MEFPDKLFLKIGILMFLMIGLSANVRGQALTMTVEGIVVDI
jgi:hypothetical protein